MTIEEIADGIDRLRVVPRVLVLAYCIWLGTTINWFYHLESVNKIECNAEVIEVLLDRGASMKEAKDTACNVVDVIGPVTAHVTFIGLVTGIAPAIFGLYVNSGKRTSREE